ncbi:MAG: UDP-glucose--hexose-1-phosphate uridylyltransferase [Acidobacteriaceae bacterium]
MNKEQFQLPHRRYNPLRGQWILVSPQRTQRPWQGEVSALAATEPPLYDPTCYLCPGNERSQGQRNQDYKGIFAFDNDFPSLLPDLPTVADASNAVSNPLLMAEPERGVSRVICFHPNHSLTLAQMEREDIVAVVGAWTDEFRTLGSQPFIQYVQIFENRGAMMGASNPHPHCQIWATEHVPMDPAEETETQLAYQEEHGRCLLCDYLKVELESGERVICANDSFVAVVPFWAVWPFETLILSRSHFADMTQMNAEQKRGLADILKRVTSRYDHLFGVSFPYSMGFHQRPTDGSAHEEWHFHAHFYPPLLRSATVRKHMVGFELLGMPQRDITPESAAERLRSMQES